MRTVPVLDWTCSHCGADETLELVRIDRDAAPMPPTDGARPASSLDWTCSRCGTTETYALVRRR